MSASNGQAPARASTLTKAQLEAKRRRAEDLELDVRIARAEAAKRALEGRRRTSDSERDWRRVASIADRAGEQATKLQFPPEIDCQHTREFLEQQRTLRESGEAWDWIDALMASWGGANTTANYYTTFGGWFVSSANDRRHGHNWPFWRTWWEHARHRQASRIMYGLAGIASGPIKNIRSFVIGKGFQYRVVPRKNVNAPAELVTAVQHFLDYRFLEPNKWKRKEREVFIRTCRDGEWFLRSDVQEGETKCWIMEPEWVIDPPERDPEINSYGVINSREDLTDITGYWVAQNGSSPDGEEVPASEMVHHKHNVDDIVKRGCPDLAFDTYENLRRVRALLENSLEGGAIQAAIAFFRKHAAATPAQVDDFREDVRTRTRYNPVTDRDESVEEFEPGTIPNIDAHQEIVTPPFAANVPGYVELLQAGYRAIAVGWGAPEWIVSADASNSNFASSLVAEAPFVKRCEDTQTEFIESFMLVIWRAVRAWCEEGRLSVAGKTYAFETVRALVDIECTPPIVKARDALAESQTNSVYVQMGVKSRQRVADEQGLDWEQMEEDNAEYDEKHGAPGMGLPMPGAGGEPIQAPDTDGFLDEPLLTPDDTAGMGDERPASEAVLEEIDRTMEEAGFTGMLTDKAGRKRHYVNGKQVAGGAASTTGAQAKKKAKAAAAAPAPAQHTPQQVQHVKATVAQQVKAAALKMKDVRDRFGAAIWDKLPAPAQKAAEFAYRTGHFLLHKAESGLAAGKGLALEVARQKGKSDEHVERVGRILAVADNALAWFVNMPATLAVTGSITTAKVSSFLPLASMAYVAFSYVTNPLATIKGARQAIRDLPKGAKNYLRGTHESVEDFDREAVDAILAGFEAAGDPDWYEALLCVAMDEADGDLVAATQMASDAIEEQPKQPEQVEEDLAPVEQSKPYTCGPAALRAVCLKFGLDKSEAELAEMLGSSPDAGTDPVAMVNGIRRLGLVAEPTHGMTAEQLAAADGPVLVCIQALNEPADGNDGGHWCVATEVGPGTVTLLDPADGHVKTLSLDAFMARWHDVSGSGEEFRQYGIVVGDLVDDDVPEGFSGERKDSLGRKRCYSDGKLVPCADTDDAASSADGGKEDPAAGRPSKPGERRKDVTPPVKEMVMPPPPRGKAGGNKAGGLTATGETNTRMGDMAEAALMKLGLRSILPPGKRQNPLDVEYDHSGWAFEIKACSINATEYKAKPKAAEMEDKRAYAAEHKLKPAMMIAVVDHEKGEIHAYWRPGIGAWGLTEGNKDQWNYAGTVKTKE